MSPELAVYKHRQETSGTTPTSYGQIETVGSTASGSESDKGFYGDDDDSDRPLPDQHTAEQVGEQAEEKFDDFKEEITSATGDLEEDLGRLNVEVV